MRSRLQITAFAGIFLCAVFVSCKSEDAISITREGRILTEAKRYPEAMAKFDEAIALDPTYIDVYLGRGKAFEDQNKLEEALAEYQRAVKLAPKHVSAHMILGNAYRRIGKMPEALRAVEYAVELSPGEAWMRNILGKLYLQVRDRHNAKVQLQKAVDMEGNEAEFRMDLAQFLESEGEYRDALLHYQAVIPIVKGLPRWKAYEDKAKAKVAELTSK
jgi:tetratricopeptide (TPR) repeat protein